jgi:hypothetical protein
MAPETRARIRVIAPFVLAAVCLIAAGWTGPLVTALLTIAAFGLVLDGATTLFARGGGLREYRQ